MSIISDKHITAQAEQWFIKLQSDKLTEAQFSEFKNWYNSDQTHQLEFNRIEKDWSTISRYTNQQSYQTYKNQHRNSQKRQYYYKAAAGLCVLLIGLSVFFHFSFEQTQSKLYQTHVGEQASYTLTDGSRVTLNTNSQLEVSFEQSLRKLSLISGEAYFRVAKDKSRPFQVSLSSGLVTALGTEFSIKVDKHNASVVVTEGTVKVEERKTPSNHQPESKQLTVNDSVSFTSRGLGKVTKNINDNLVSWKEKFLVFDSRPLEEVISELNRYLPYSISITDKLQRTILISGTVNLDNPETALRTLLKNNDLEFDDQELIVHES
ncbi:FecR family protein [Teredinibacter sp. KSP-S5-2]|uniref:FecR family protein n=1 Tax=Teredinibacter sp. KSP-S5-2 TaxID=3034506 RepID=UPI002934F858|nr:FecR domain-containing protein [Teredinibacter sp. KSP-S5-2]WNO08037.1 FecR domain-containing protein [Teredinibacter sp. KSP-S5-2]